MTALPFGISTHLFHGERLVRRHVEAIAAHDFRLVEVFATRTHFDYHDANSVADVRRWLDGAGLRAWGLHAPITDRFTGGMWGQALSNASPDAARREEAVRETVAAIRAAGELGCSTVILHLGIPRGQPIPPGDNDRGSLKRSLVPITDACRGAGVSLALEVIPNELATAPALLEWLDADEDVGPLGACLDVGHAHLTGGTVEAAELLAGYLVSTHLHDNRGRDDDHLVPFDGSIDWVTTLMALTKVGYSGPLVFEVPDHGDASRVLDRLASARHRLQTILASLSETFDFADE